MRIGEALAQAATRLSSEGVESPRFDAELLLAHVLDANRAAILARPDLRLTPKQLTRYRDLVARRAGRPAEMEQRTGDVGVRFAVNDVFPESEEAGVALAVIGRGVLEAPLAHCGFHF